MLGTRENYFIKDGYTIRPEYVQFDDTPFRDEFQDRVYSYARGILQLYRLGSVVDIGCGSGFKLLKYFSDVRTLGVDVPTTVEWLKKTYRHRKWEAIHLEGQLPAGYDLGICSDVIEHVPNPDVLMEFLSNSSCRRLIISTPDRDALNLGTEDGPPRNVHHIREWNSDEFKQYVRCYFQIVHHIEVGGTQFVEVVL